MAFRVGRLVSPELKLFFLMLAVLLLAITAFIVLTLDVFNFIGKENQRYISDWEQIAPQIEFEFNRVEQGKAARDVLCVLTGKVHQFNCRVVAQKVMKSVESEDGGSFIQHTVRMEVDLPQPLDMGLNIRPQGTGMPFFKNFFKKEELALDDEFFDEHFFVKGRDATTVNQFLTIERKSTIYNTLQSIAPFGVEITDSMVAGGSFEKVGVQQIIHVMKQLVAVADTLTDHSSEAEADFWDSAP